MNAKHLIAIASLILVAVLTQAKQRGPELTTEQKECLQSKIGDPGSGDRPSRESMKAAFEACGVEAPAHHGRGRGGPPGGRMELTDEQRACLEGEMGAPGEGSERPSREAMEAAFSKCGIEKPSRPHSKNGASPARASVTSEDESIAELDQLKSDFQSADGAETKDEIRESIADLFQSTQNETVRTQIRNFLKANPPSKVKSSIGSRTAAVLK